MSKSGIIDNEKELIDVVNEMDEVIDTKTKGEVHSNNLIHREIAVLVVDENGNLLLQQRSFKKKYFPGEWTVTAVGHVPSGKTPEEAAHEELEEELGFDAPLKFVEKRKYESDNHTSYGYLFLGMFPRGGRIIPDENEVQKAEFKSKEQVHKMIEDKDIGPHSRVTINKYLSGIYQ